MDTPLVILYFAIALGCFILGFTICTWVYGQTFKVNDTYCKTPHFKANYLCSTEHFHDKLSPPIDIRDDAIPQLH